MYPVCGPIGRIEHPSRLSGHSHKFLRCLSENIEKNFRTRVFYIDCRTTIEMLSCHYDQMKVS